VVGPFHFVRRVYRELKKQHKDVDLKGSPPVCVSIVDGYSKIAQNDSSQLGWRIVIYCDPFEGCDQVVSESVSANIELALAIPGRYRSRHLAVAQLVEKARSGDKLSKKEQQEVASAIGCEIDNLKTLLGGPSAEEMGDVETRAVGELPNILCTSLLGSKGLSANHVFIVGMNNGHFPQNPSAITDTEACQLIVGLARARKQCFVVSCGRFGREEPTPSIFLHWIKDRLSYEYVDAEYLRQLAVGKAS